jgi:hypothetical protein
MKYPGPEAGSHDSVERPASQSTTKPPYGACRPDKTQDELGLLRVVPATEAYVEYPTAKQTVSLSNDLESRLSIVVAFARCYAAGFDARMVGWVSS